MSISAIDKIYNSLSEADDYVDFPETESARKKLKAYLMENILSADDEEAHKQWLDLEKVISEFGVENERQGFILGFRYAVELLVRGEKPGGRGRLDENIKEEYSTLAVERTDKTEPVVDILKEYVPKEKFEDAVDTLGVCIENTKYAVFEQGFLRGIAAEKGGNI